MKYPLLLACLCYALFSHSQSATLYFDNDTTTAIQLNIDTAVSSWQVGAPQKAVFDSAASAPNVLITRTDTTYPINDSSVAEIAFDPQTFNWGILALQWTQQLDLESARDFGVLEFSSDNGATWHNAFDDPNVYNFYGFDQVNTDTMPNGEWAFTGTDSTWNDIWLCFDYSFVSGSIMRVRYTLLSDSNETNQDGWMIDNFSAHITIIHTVGEEPQQEYLKVYPSVTDDIVHIQGQKLDVFHG